MNSFVVYDALVVGLKEGLKAGALCIVFSAYLAVTGRKDLLRPFIGGPVAALALSCAVFLFYGQATLSREVAGKIMETSFAAVLFLSIATLLHSSAMPLFPRVERAMEAPAVAAWTVFAGALFFQIPDMLGAGLLLRDAAAMGSQGLPSALSASAGLAAACLLSYAVYRFLNPSVIGGFVGLPQFLLFSAMVKLFGGGIKGISELSLIPAVQRGLMKFSHDFVHQTFVILMVPDHPLLKTTAWNFIGILFGPNLASFEALLLLLVTPVMFIWFSLAERVDLPGTESPAQRRKVVHGVMSGRRKRALPVAAFAVIIMVAWLADGGETISRLEVPKPKPVVEDKGAVMIPVNDPTMDLYDGSLHKFSLLHQGEKIRLLIIKRPDSRLAVCLDACEICPPEGYGLREQNVICIYCNTPIPVSSLGQPGGCNPIPVAHSVDDRFVRIEVGEILRQWQQVKTGKGRETVK